MNSVEHSGVPMIALNDPCWQNDRYGTIEMLRAQNFFACTPDGHRLFLNQEDVMELFRCERFRFTFNHIDHAKSPYLAKAIEHELLNMHGEQHARLSRLLKRALRDRVIDGLNQKIEQIVDSLILPMPGNGEVEFCRDFADPLPSHVMGPMFDIPYEQTEGLNEWIRIGGRKIDALESGTGIEDVESANRQLHHFLRRLIRDRSIQPGDDLLSELLITEIDGDTMSEDEIVYLAGELASAGVDTTRAQLPLIMLALLNHPDQLHRLRENPDLAEKAVDEGMRYAPLPWVIPHSATHEFDYKGISFKTGDLVYAVVPAANRDPAAMTYPDVFDITRDRTRHFSFGSGMHVCPGIRLARMEMATAIRKFLAAFSDIALLEPCDWVAGQTDRTLKTLRLKVTR